MNPNVRPIEINPLDQKQLRTATNEELLHAYDKYGWRWRHGAKKYWYLHRAFTVLIAMELRRRKNVLFEEKLSKGE